MIYELSKAVYDKPDFNTMNEKEVTQHLIQTLERNHRDNNTKTLNEATRFINRLSGELVSSKERKLLITTEKNYFSGEYERILNELEG